MVVVQQIRIKSECTCQPSLLLGTGERRPEAQRKINCPESHSDHLHRSRFPNWCFHCTPFPSGISSLRLTVPLLSPGQADDGFCPSMNAKSKTFCWEYPRKPQVPGSTHSNMTPTSSNIWTPLIPSRIFTFSWIMSHKCQGQAQNSFLIFSITLPWD